MYVLKHLKTKKYRNLKGGWTEDIMKAKLFTKNLVKFVEKSMT